MSPFRRVPFRRVLAWGLALGLAGAWAAPASAEVPELLGKLAIALEDDVAAELGLSDAAKGQLTKLAEQREDAGLDLLLQAKDLPKPEQEAKLAPYRKQSEDYAKRVLSADQWAKLGKIVVRRQGLLSLRDASVAGSVKLTAEQQAQRDKLLGDLDAKSGTLDEAGRRALEGQTERSLRQLLTPEQLTAWQDLAGEIPGAAVEAPLPSAPESPATTASSVPVAAPNAAPSAPNVDPPANATVATPASPANPVAPAMSGPAIPAGAPATNPAPTATAGTPGATGDAAAAPPASGERGTPLTPSLPAPGTIPGAVPSPGSPAAAASGATTSGPTTNAATTANGATTTKAPAASRTTTTSTAPRGPDGEYQLKFNFRYQPWGEVLDWFARQADLSLVMDAPPPGTFNYSDTRTYSPAQAIDLLNSVLLTKGYTLLRRERMLLVVNLEDGVPPNLVTYVPLDKIDALGDYELVKTLFPLGTMTGPEAEAEIRPLLGPQGAIAVLPKAKQIVVTETAGRLRAIRDILKSAGDAPGPTAFQVFELQHADVDAVVGLLRQLMDIPADKFATSDGSLRFATDVVANKLIVTGTTEKIARAKEIIQAGDVAGPETTGETGTGALETPQLEVYAAGESDPNSVLAVLQTLLAGQPDARLAVDPKTGNIVALARPGDHATIRATLGQLERDGKKVEVFRLRKLDPQLAVLAINKLFGGEAAGGTAPKVEADKSLNQVLVRGSEAQVAQIRDLLNQMGESQYGAAPGDAVAQEDRGKVRLIPLTGRASRTALQQLQELWPTMRPNRIRVVSPDKALPEIGRAPGANPTGATNAPPAAGSSLPLELLRGMGPNTIRQAPARPSPNAAGARPATPERPTTGDSTTANERRVPATLPSLLVRPVAQVAPAPNAAGGDETAPAPDASANPPAGGNAAAADAPKAAAPVGPPAEIVVIPGPGGLMIASDDAEALDEFEALLESLTSAQFSGGREFTIFYLKSAPAVVVAETLQTVFSISPPDGGGGGGSLLGDLANNALGGMGGGIMGAMLGIDTGGGSSAPVSSGSLQIVPEPRLNALIVQGPPKDLDAIEQLLEVLDQEDLPDTLVASKPRILPIKYQAASDVLNTLKQVYADRLTSGSGGQPRQPSPEEFIQMLRGGRGGRGGGGQQQNRQAEAQKMSIGVDARGNSLIVVAPQSLYEEVEQLVATLDVPNEAGSETTEVVAVRRTNAVSVQRAVQAIVGPQVTTTNPPQQTGTNNQNRNNQGNRGQQGNNPADFFNNLQRAMQGGQGNRGNRGGFGTQGGRGNFGGGNFGGGFGGQGGRGGR